METQIKTEPVQKKTTGAMQRITPFLWFDHQAEEAVQFYTSLFKNSSINAVTYYTPEMANASGMPVGSLLTVAFQLEGMDFVAMNAGPVFQLTPAISFFVSCQSHREIDTLWRRFSNGGTPMMPLDKYPFSEKFGWIKDRFGVTWQLMLTNTPLKISTFLMFVGDQKGKAEEAINFYLSLFPNSGIQQLERFGQEGGETPGTVKHARFTLDGQELMAMDSNMDHPFTFTPAISLVVNCETQEEIDHYWDQLTQGGDERAQQCGWLQDRFGVSWQIVPIALMQILSEPDSKKRSNALQAMLQMKKIDLPTIMKAYEQI